MSDTRYVKSPLSEQDMELKLDEIRNGVASKMKSWADRVQISMATTPQIQRVEGEHWKEDGKLWTVKDGAHQSISILSETRMPIWCPKCSLPMNHRFDRKFYFLRGHCFNCNVDIEGEMRINGTWEVFEKRLVRENEKAFLRDKINEHMEYIRTFKEPQIHFQDGRWEKLASISDFKELFETLEKDIDFMLARLEYMKKEETNDETDIR